MVVAISSDAPDAKGGHVLQPRIESGMKVFDVEASRRGGGLMLPSDPKDDFN